MPGIASAVVILTSARERGGGGGVEEDTPRPSGLCLLSRELNHHGARAMTQNSHQRVTYMSGHLLRAALPAGRRPATPPILSALQLIDPIYI